MRGTRRPRTASVMVPLFKIQCAAAAHSVASDRDQFQATSPASFFTSSAKPSSETSCWAPVFSSFSRARPAFSSASPRTSANRAPSASARLSWFPGFAFLKLTSAAIPAARSCCASSSARAASASPSGAMNTSGRVADPRDVGAPELLRQSVVASAPGHGALGAETGSGDRLVRRARVVVEAAHQLRVHDEGNVQPLERLLHPGEVRLARVAEKRFHLRRPRGDFLALRVLAVEHADRIGLGALATVLAEVAGAG